MTLRYSKCITSKEKGSGRLTAFDALDLGDLGLHLALDFGNTLHLDCSVVWLLLVVANTANL